MVGNHHRRALSAMGLGAVLAVATCVVVTPAQAASDALLTGSIVDQSGGRGTTAVTVTVEAWPTGDVLDALPAGADVPTRIVQTVQPNANGAYVVDPDLSTLGSDYVEDDGAVNLDVTVNDESNGGTENLSFAAAQPGTRAAADPSVAVAGIRPQLAGFDLSASTVTTALGAQAATTSGTANGHDATSADTAGHQPDVPARGVGCGLYGSWKDVKTYPKRAQSFLDLYTHGTAEVSEEVGSSHSIAVGVAVTGGSWSQSGSVEVEAHSAAGGTVSYARNYRLRNNVNIHHYMQKCLKRDKHTFYYRHQQRTTSLHSLLVGGTAIADRAWPMSGCQKYARGTFHKTRGSNVTISGGVDGPFVNVNARAAYSTDTSVTWSPRNVYLCGSSSAGWVTAATAGTDDNPNPSSGGCGARCNVVEGEESAQSR